MRTPGGVEPVGLDEYRARLAALSAPRRYAIAVSGGSDSMALARLAAEHAARGEAEALALIVDHGLRQGSAAEAEQARSWCVAAKLPTRVLRWTGAKPQTGVQEAARNARYRLLIEAAQADERAALLTAHTADDQAETTFMRLARGAGPRGLAAMEADTLVAAGAGPPLRLLRPFLDAPRARLAATAARFGQRHLDDPSNEDPRFERVRTRALLGALEEQGILTQDALLRAAVRARAGSALLEKAIMERFDRLGGCFHRLGYATLARCPTQDDAPVVARLISAVGGGEFEPNEERTTTAIDAFERTGAATLGGVIIKAHSGKIFVAREPAALLGRAGEPAGEPVVAPPSTRVLWDRRFIAINESDAAAEIVPLGQTGEARLAKAAALADAPLEALAAAPAQRGETAQPLRFAPLAPERFWRRVTRFC
jgi:tRNA(Ile)-lysidine synthase